jgi:uncharacterized protein YhfF
MPSLASVARGVQLAQIIFLCDWCEEHNAWADTAAQPRAATESLVTIPHSIQPFWLKFQAIVGGDVQARFYEAFHFDDNESSANKLAQLVLVGTKRATAGLTWAFEAENRPPPKPGDLSVVTNWQGEPLCVIETKAVATVPFEEVSEEFAAIEGEGDGSLRYWREVHWAYFGRVCKRIGRVPSPRMPVVCERFEVIYRGAPPERAA